MRGLESPWPPIPLSYSCVAAGQHDTPSDTQDASNTEGGVRHTEGELGELVRPIQDLDGGAGNFATPPQLTLRRPTIACNGRCSRTVVLSLCRALALSLSSVGCNRANPGLRRLPQRRNLSQSPKRERTAASGSYASPAAAAAAASASCCARIPSVEQADGVAKRAS